MFSSYDRDDPSKLVLVQQYQDSCLFMRDISGISPSLCRAIRTLIEVRRETQCAFLVATVLLGFLSIFNNSHASLPFETLNSMCLWTCQMDVKPPLQMRQGPRAFFRVSTGDSDIPSSGEMKDEPAFKPLEGNLAFFQVRASQCPFHLRQQTQGPSHLPIYEGCLLLRCFWNVGLPL